MKRKSLALIVLCLLLAACASGGAPPTAAETPTQPVGQPPEPPQVPPLDGAKSVELAGINWHADGDTLDVFGLAQNNGASDLQDVLVMLRLLDAGGQSIDAASRELPLLPAGGRAPFFLTFSASLDWQDYEAVFLQLPEGPNTVLHAGDFEIVSAEERPGSCHSVPGSVFDLAVEVRNTGRQGNAYELLAALFDASGRIVGVSAAWICAELDESIFFEVSVGPAEIAGEEIASYELFVYGYVLGE